MSQYTPENLGKYKERPSIITSSLLANRELKPRILTAQELPSICATCTPGTKRNTSGRLVFPLRRISSSVTT